MFKVRRKSDLIIPLLQVFIDVVAIEAAFLIAYWLRFHSFMTSWIPVTKGFPGFQADQPPQLLEAAARPDQALLRPDPGPGQHAVA